MTLNKTKQNKPLLHFVYTSVFLYLSNTLTQMHTYICIKVKLAIVVVEVTTAFPVLLHFPLDPYLIILSVMQEGIKYHWQTLCQTVLVVPISLHGFVADQIRNNYQIIMIIKYI